MKKALFTLLVALFATTALAQSEQRENPAARRTEMIQKRAAQLVKAMRLTDEDESWFTELYTEYQDSLYALRQALRPQSQPEEVNGMKDMKKISDEEASQMILNQFTMEEQQVAVKRAYYEQFKNRLTPKQLMLVFMGPAMGGQRQQQGQQQDGMRRGWGGPGFGGPGGWGGPGRF